MKWEFELDLNTDGGLELSNRLKKGEITLTFGIDLTKLYCNNYPLINGQSSFGKVPEVSGYIIANILQSFLIIYTTKSGSNYGSAQKIGQLISLEGMSESNLKKIAKGDSINLVLAYESIEEPDTTKIAEINKKIIIIMIIGLSILIILLIIKFIVK